MPVERLFNLMIRRQLTSGFRTLCVSILTFVMCLQLGMAQKPQGELARKVKSQVTPLYPDLARRMNVKGSVKLLVTVAANGSVKSTKVVGGHPLLVTASEDAIRRWKFEPAAEESTGVIEFNFSNN